MMGTFVTVGNGTQGFSRLFRAIADIHGELPQPVIVQGGHGAPALPGCTVFDFVDHHRFVELIRDNDLIITHGGVGSIITAIEHGKKPVVVSRRSGAYAEIVNDHQLSLMGELAGLGLVSPVMAVDDLGGAIMRIVREGGYRQDSGSAVGSIRREYLEQIGDAISSFCPKSKWSRKICLVSACGGHLTELGKLRPVFEAYPHFYVINNPIVEPPEMTGRTYVITLCERDWRGFINIWEAFRILRRERPDCIVSTGAWPAIPFAIVGRVLGIPNVYVETMARVDRPTATGRMMYHLSHRFFYPWRQLAGYFPRGEYCGLLF